MLGAGATRGWIERDGSPWRDRARELRIRVRDRFRVVVDRHIQQRRAAWEQDDYTVALRRWVERLRGVWADAQAPAKRVVSSRFYRKRVDKDIAAGDESIVIRMLQNLAVPVIGNACYAFMHGLNRVQIYGAEKLHQALLQRPEGKPLLTVSNHVASIDDPFVIASLLPPGALLNAPSLRWTLCATDRCFKNPMMSTFFRSVKVLPVSRGDGIYQKGMDLALSKLNNGGWVHIFPEGSRSRDGGRTMGTTKRGVGRLVVDADTVPMVIPFVHSGMQEIMPIGTSFPKIGKTVTVVIGEPIFLDDLLADKDDPEHVSTGILYDAVSSRIGHRLQELKFQVDRLVLEHSSEIKDDSRYNQENGCKIWRQVDWEAFGMGNYMLEERTHNVRSVHDNQPVQLLAQQQDRNLSSRTVRFGFSYEGGIVSRIRGYMNPSELMSFAARGLFMNNRTSETTYPSIQEMGPRIWKQFVEGELFHRWNMS